MRRVISNVEVSDLGDDEITATANFVIYEVAAQSSGELRVWPGHAQYRLRRVDGVLQMSAKWVELVTAEIGQRNLTFLI
jgi:3-phenylpropionate/cinnamic acid dioxygenase small subunit